MPVQQLAPGPEFALAGQEVELAESPEWVQVLVQIQAPQHEEQELTLPVAHVWRRWWLAAVKTVTKSTHEAASRSSPPKLKLPNCIPIFSREFPNTPLGMTTASSALNLCR